MGRERETQLSVSAVHALQAIAAAFATIAQETVKQTELQRRSVESQEALAKNVAQTNEEIHRIQALNEALSAG